MTTEASTTIPTEKASPPRLIRLEEIPVWPMIRKVMRKVMGREARTMRAERISAIKRKRIRITKIPPSSRALTTVSMQASMRVVRS